MDEVMEIVSAEEMLSGPTEAPSSIMRVLQEDSSRTGVNN